MIELGAQHVDIGQGCDTDHVVLADPEGNELCVVLRGEFLADTDFDRLIALGASRIDIGHSPQ